MKVIPSIKDQSPPPDPRTHVLSPLAHDNPISPLFDLIKFLSLKILMLVSPVLPQPPDPQTTVFSPLVCQVPFPNYLKLI
jgi:hypothetical protein